VIFGNPAKRPLGAFAKKSGWQKLLDITGHFPLEYCVAVHI
jgi:hypothetical protein